MMRNFYCKSYAINFFKKGIALLLLISCGLTARANPAGAWARSRTITPDSSTFAVHQAATCAYTFGNFLPSTSAVAPAAATAGEGSVLVTAARNDCQWTASSQTNWITIPEEQTLVGTRTFNFSYGGNVGAARSGTITIAGETFTVYQAAATCAYAFRNFLPVTSVTTRATPAAGEGSVLVTAGRNDCQWAASSQADWITIPTGQTLVGTRTFNFSYGANVGAARSGTITIAGETFTVHQGAEPCSFTLPSNAAVTAAAGRGNVWVTAAHSAC